MPSTPSGIPDRAYPDADTLADHWWWRPGWQVGTRFYAWHITVADLPALAEHVATHQQALSRFGFLDPVPREWLHITVQGLDHIQAVDDATRDRVLAEVGRRLEGITAPTLTFARPVLFTEAIVIPPTDPEPLSAIRDAIRDGIQATYGTPEGKPPNRFRPHVSAAYVNQAADPRPVREALDALDVPPVHVPVTHVSLIEMHRDNRMYEWTKIAEVPLRVNR
ncbi:MAG TPA: 2'-5' RNA ligase family protein [Kineosporiaceae bacterium]|nr:2'-5' RNA ligase family protein [Kineosporiaceae bacterium]